MTNRGLGPVGPNVLFRLAASAGVAGSTRRRWPALAGPHGIGAPSRLRALAARMWRPSASATSAARWRASRRRSDSGPSSRNRGAPGGDAGAV